MSDSGGLKSCFVISPIGARDSETRRRSDQVLRYIIRPAAAECGYEVVRADEISDPGLISTQVLSRLAEADLVIADLWDGNPNVFYELGVRHAVGKPVIHIVDNAQQIPFDVQGFRSIELDHRDLDSVFRARDAIIDTIGAIEDQGPNFQGLVHIAEALRAKRVPQEIKIHAYLNDDDVTHAKNISQAVTLIEQALKLVITDDPPAQSGSWFKRWVAKTTESLSLPEVNERLHRMERMLKLRSDQIDQSEAVVAAGQAIVGSLEGVDNAVVQVGSLLIVKKTASDESVGRVLSFMLRQEELAALERDPSLLMDTAGILNFLAAHRPNSPELIPFLFPDSSATVEPKPRTHIEHEHYADPGPDASPVAEPEVSPAPGELWPDD